MLLRFSLELLGLEIKKIWAESSFNKDTKYTPCEDPFSGIHVQNKRGFENYFFFFYVHWCFTCMCTCVRGPCSLELKFQTVVSCGCWELNKALLEELAAFITPVSALQLQGESFGWHGSQGKRGAEGGGSEAKTSGAIVSENFI